ncbi:DUF1273 domain-containing protein [Vagococcus lutrae]|uniref:DUF1273 domain-containing protein n=1 Tax=Vagococcus lutrae TaxID=81947 RepID=UPI00288D035E|nr:DUF1273 domain-containing protein [Vagococcus lutrae]MDT2806327.1 DUF1273 domain-containing protein [Vagococcus lutrae]MDT2824579.1 DUF1273 domain-containing protein [Vagococcus lutrae]
MVSLIKRLWLSGYRSYELGVFKKDDPKEKIIKKVLRERLIYLIENGTEWIISSGNLGVELWGIEIAEELKSIYPEIKTSLIFPFADFGSQWNETNQFALTTAKNKVDFVDSVSHQPYTSPSQLKNHTQFLLTHTDGALLVYDSEFEGKPSYIYRDIQKKQEHSSYFLELISMFDLQDAAENNI